MLSYIICPCAGMQGRTSMLGRRFWGQWLKFATSPSPKNMQLQKRVGSLVVIGCFELALVTCWNPGSIAAATFMIQSCSMRFAFCSPRFCSAWQAPLRSCCSSEGNDLRICAQSWSLESFFHLLAALTRFLSCACVLALRGLKLVQLLFCLHIGLRARSVEVLMPTSVVVFFQQPFSCCLAYRSVVQ